MFRQLVPARVIDLLLFFIFVVTWGPAAVLLLKPTSWTRNAYLACLLLVQLGETSEHLVEMKS
ncbi:hypothetical protein DL93DRAFT_2086065 [Clavulina sp. PMI_390]|nr:hypothetical protein DL93DRAFT_2086065 [Clavulina sp. PMI_390]